MKCIKCGGKLKQDAMELICKKCGQVFVLFEWDKYMEYLGINRLMKTDDNKR